MSRQRNLVIHHMYNKNSPFKMYYNRDLHTKCWRIGFEDAHIYHPLKGAIGLTFSSKNAGYVYTISNSLANTLDVNNISGPSETSHNASLK